MGSPLPVLREHAELEKPGLKRYNKRVHGLDIQIFKWINGWSAQWKDLYVFFSEASKETGIRIGIAIIAILLLAAGPNTRKTGLIAIVSVIMSNTLADGMKQLFKMQRPCVELDTVTLWVGRLDSYGTASSHSANMAALAFVMVYFFRWWGIPWVVVALLTGISRIYVGVHYPSQVLLGYLCGVLCAFLVIKTWEAFVRSRNIGKNLDASGGKTNDKGEDPCLAQPDLHSR
jgi:undecaprenyl-diphosphatase